MKPKNLLAQLSRLEATLNDFSFEELTSSEASHLKKSFQAFKVNLEERIFQPAAFSVIKDGSYSEEDIKPDKKNTQVQNTVNATMLVAKVSHEIRTPLNGIIGFTDLLKEDTLTNKQLERVDAIQTASFSLMEIINELLEYSKLTSGMEHFECVDFNFKAIVHDVMYLCSTLITDKNIKLEMTIDPEIPLVLSGDPSKLSQILLNLLGNAIKFVEKGSILLSIHQKKIKNGLHFLEFSIADTGIGIFENHLEHIFDPFKQAEQNTYSRFGGSGLGLSIVKQIVENLGGDISVSSSLGVGTTFKFFIPYEKGNAKNLEKKNKNVLKIEKNKLLVKDMSILVFEDNLLNQRLIEQRLKIWGCKTFITDNAQVGLDILEKHHIELVLMDLKMPGMNGFEITACIRSSKNKYISQIPVIALTADFSIRDKEKCKAHGINDFILKPYDADVLLLKLSNNRNSMKATISEESKVVKPAIENNKKHLEFDLSPVLEECMGEVSLLKELVVLYKGNILEFIGAIRMHIENNDLEQIAFSAHKIKAGLKMMRSDSLHFIIEQMQTTCKADGDIKHIKFLLCCFVDEYPDVENAIDQAMKEIGGK